MAPVKQNRRTFLRTAGGLALFGLCTPAGAVHNVERTSVLPADGPSRIAVFFEDGFPGVDDFSTDRASLTRELSGIGASGVDFLDSSRLRTDLDVSTHRLFINPFGSAFPEAAWPSIRHFLSGGGNLLNLGGVPFSVGVSRNPDGKPVKGQPRPTFHRELGITQSFDVPVDEIERYEDRRDGRDGPGLSGLVEVRRVFELYVRFTSTRDYPGEDGTSGQRDAEIFTEVGGFDRAGDMIAAPVVRIERLLGEFAGGIWILANFTGALKEGAIREMAGMGYGPVLRAAVQPTFATYMPGESPAFTLRAPDPERSFSGQIAGDWTVSVTDSSGRTVHAGAFSARDFRDAPAGQYVLPGETVRMLVPGLYTVHAALTPSDAGFRGRGRIHAENGFWIMDKSLLAGARRLKPGRTYFSDGGATLPVVGTSYMSGTVQRKFLFEPDPVTWERDFREMKDAGINMVRTGIWTGWKNIMLDVGSLDEGSLRAIDAFLLTAARHDIPVIFTFFAFLPESWGGENPYLDPRAVQAQSIFLSTIARRYAGAPGVIWDLINEPSFCSPDHLWQCRPNYDAHEIESWKEWMEARPASPGARGPADRFRLSTEASPGLPRLEDFSDRNIIGDTRPLLASEYRLFAQERFGAWAKIMADVVRREAGEQAIVTVGQDEGGTSERPGPHFFADNVDFTSMHNWWYNDDLLWDSLMTSVPGKANLIGETGVMFYETADGLPWRGEEDVRDLAERKLAITFASGAAGFINWLWNTNPYMDSDNEAGIGLKRADGTHKPEFDSVRRYARFFGGQGGLMAGREDEETVMVIPHSNLFTNRNTATSATRTCVRIMEYHCRTPMRGVSEFGLDRLDKPPTLLVLPSPVIFDRQAWSRLMTLVKGGSTLLVSGPFDRDRYYLPGGRMAVFGLSPSVEPVGTEEFLSIDGKEFRLGFRGDKMQRIEKGSSRHGEVPSVEDIPLGAGRIVYSPVPVELSDSPEAVEAFYRYGIAAAGLTGRITVETKDPSVLVRTIVFSDALMVTFVPEGNSARPVTFTLTESSKRYTVTVPPRRPIVHFYGRRDGVLLAALEPSRRTH